MRVDVAVSSVGTVSMRLVLPLRGVRLNDRGEIFVAEFNAFGRAHGLNNLSPKRPCC
jgi:hypothetical protein